MSYKKPKDPDDLTHAYDHALKRLFAHSIMVTHLIRGFVPESWAKDLDFSTLTRVNEEHETHDLQTRENDIIWRIEFRKRPLFIICLLEFQSDIDKFMALRILNYVSLVYQDLLDQGKQALFENDKLPPVFSLVLYTGSRKWNAPTALKDCYAPYLPEGLGKFQPHIEYMVLDVGRISLDESKKMKDNLVSSFIELEQTSEFSESQEIVNRLAVRLKDKQFDRLRYDILSYVKRALKLQKKFPTIEIHELCEVSMLSETFDRRDEKLRQEGKEEARQEARQEAHQLVLSVVLKLLEKQSGHVSMSLKQKLEKSTFEELQHWIDKLINEDISVS